MGLEVAEVFRRFGDDYLARHGATILPSHRRALADIISCRTPARGGHLWHCPDCDRDVYVYHGCRNRSCPACHTTQTQTWLDARQAELLPCDHFHVTITLPDQLRSLIRHHQKDLYGRFMQVAADALLTLCRDPKHLGATPGILAVLHTWTAKMDYHVHVHFLVTAGGISRDGFQWIPAKPGFLVPVKALSRLVRTRLRAVLLQGEYEVAIPESVWQQEWVANCLPWAAGEQGVLNYLARYVFRIAITNCRIVDMDDETVTFKYKHRKQNRFCTCRLPGHEFLRRYLQHVLPKRFHKVRYYALWHHASRHQAARARQLLLLEGASPEKPLPDSLNITANDTSGSGTTPSAADTSEDASHYAPKACPHCGGVSLCYVRKLPRPRHRGS